MGRAEHTHRFVDWPANVTVAGLLLLANGLFVWISRAVAETAWPTVSWIACTVVGVGLAARVVLRRTVVDHRGLLVRRVCWTRRLSWSEIGDVRATDTPGSTTRVEVTSVDGVHGTFRLERNGLARVFDRAVADARSAAGAGEPMPRQPVGRFAPAALLGAAAVLAILGAGIGNKAVIWQRSLDAGIGVHDSVVLDPTEVEHQLLWAQLLVLVALLWAGVAAVLLALRVDVTVRGPKDRPPDDADAPPVAPVDVKIGWGSGFYREPWGPVPDVEVTILGSTFEPTLTYRRGRFGTRGELPVPVPVWDLRSIDVAAVEVLAPAFGADAFGESTRVQRTRITFHTDAEPVSLVVHDQVEVVRSALRFTGRLGPATRLRDAASGRG